MPGIEYRYSIEYRHSVEHGYSMEYSIEYSMKHGHSIYEKATYRGNWFTLYDPIQPMTTKRPRFQS